MELYIKENDKFIKVKEIETTNENSECLIFMLNCRIRDCDRINMEQELTIKTGKQCIVLDGIVNKAVGV